MFFFTGVAFVGVVADLVAGFAADFGGLAVVLVGVGPVPVVTVLEGLGPTVVAAGVLRPAALSFLGTLFTGVVAASVALEAAGVTLLVVVVPVAVAGFEALLTAVFPVEVAVAAVFFTGVATDFAGVDVVVVAAGFVSVAVAGAFRTGSFFCVPRGVLGLAAGVAVIVVFLTGVVFDAADCVTLLGVEAVFFAAGKLPAVLATLLTLARGLYQRLDSAALFCYIH